MKRPAIIEMVADSGKEIDLEKLALLTKDQVIKQESVYRWNNHYIIFDDISNPEKLSQQILQEFPGVKVKSYDSCFYNFNRSKCDTGDMAKEWDHIILSANLVADTVLQHEYMAYHATQFEKWPDIARGFCHAGFQQLLLFRNDRQLMLVISIPKGESLDAINPKTTENNPKMVEWNDIMKKYQEGVAGTKTGEVWVFFKQLPAISHQL